MDKQSVIFQCLDTGRKIQVQCVTKPSGTFENPNEFTVVRHDTECCPFRQDDCPHPDCALAFGESRKHYKIVDKRATGHKD